MTNASTPDQPSPQDVAADGAGTQALWQRIAELEAERADLVAALNRVAALTARLLDAPHSGPHPSAPRRARQLVDEGAAASSPDDPDPDDPYPLNASEDRAAYHRWLRERRRATVVGPEPDPLVPATRAPRRDPLVSVVVPVYNPPRAVLLRAIGSVVSQDFGDWELVLCDDCSTDPDVDTVLRAAARLDDRIRVVRRGENGGISAATNEAIGASRGRFVAFLDHDDELADGALRRVAAEIAAHDGADFFYSDEDKIDAAGERFDPLFKPDWSPDLLLSFAYTCHLTVIGRSLLDRVGGLRSEYDGSQDYDLALRATEGATGIVHIADVLYHWRSTPGSAATDTTASVAKPWAYEAGRRAIEDALARRHEPATVTEDDRFPGRYHVRRAVTGRPRVSIVIPFRDEPALLATCVATMRAAPGYDEIEFVLVDNRSELPETFALLDQLASAQVRVVAYDDPFNWPAVNNFGVRHATGEILLFSNNDIEATTPGWLDAMVGHAQRPEVGAVGAKLLYPDGSIQHAGVVIGLGGIAGHLLRGLPGERPGYNSASIATRDCSVVTGACMMTRRDVFEEAGGFREDLPVAFNDVDFCLELRRRGYLIVYTPLAELVHHESRSRGHTDDLDEHAVIVQRWAAEIVAGDPYLNANLSHWRYWCPLATPQEDYQWKTYLERSILLPPTPTPASSSSG